MDKLYAYLRLMRLDKPIGILLLLWPTLTALFLAANGLPEIKTLCIFIGGTVLMRSAGCVMNDMADRQFDGYVERTKHRPLVTGEVSKNEACIIVIILCLLAFGLVLMLNVLAIQLSIVALVLAASYPLTKRYIAIPQAYLGMAFSAGILMAYAAQTNSVPATAWWLMLANICWAIAYDTEYAMVDRDDDLKIGIKSSAITFGRYDVVTVMLFYLLMLLIYLKVGLQLALSSPYFMSLGVAVSIVIYHYWLIKTRDRDLCFAAFLHNTWLGLVIFAGVFLAVI